VAGRVPGRTQEVEDLPGLDAEVTSELLNFDSAGSGGYEWSFLFNSTGNDSATTPLPDEALKSVFPDGAAPNRGL
jgi:hypothetical protein